LQEKEAFKKVLLRRQVQLKYVITTETRVHMATAA